MSTELRQELKEVSGQRKIRAIRRLEVTEAFRKSGNNPDWMIMDIVRLFRLNYALWYNLTADDLQHQILMICIAVLSTGITV